MLGATKLLARQKYVFVATNPILLRQAYFCRDKHVFVATKHVFCRDKSMLAATKHFSRQNIFLATKVCLFCREKRRVKKTCQKDVSKMILLAAPANDTRQAGCSRLDAVRGGQCGCCRVSETAAGVPILAIALPLCLALLLFVGIIIAMSLLCYRRKKKKRKVRDVLKVTQRTNHALIYA